MSVSITFDPKQIVARALQAGLVHLRLTPFDPVLVARRKYHRAYYRKRSSAFRAAGLRFDGRPRSRKRRPQLAGLKTNLREYKAAWRKLRRAES
ncbi:MAG: hypothetical protein KGL39_17640 [Patescibacteria group bacterium]|nr:hypothetical protein [Patescibacteria group bacterium]